MEVFNKAKLAARSRGLVVIHLNQTSCRTIANNTLQELTARSKVGTQKEKTKWLHLIHLKKLLDSISRKKNPQMCGESVPDIYRRRAMLFKSPTPLKKDTSISIAFQSNNDGRESKCIGVAVYGTANKIRDGEYNEDEFPFKDDKIMDIIESGRMFELDLICTLNASKGTGSIFMLWVLAKELARKSRGGPKYDGALISLAKNPDGSMPMVNIAKRIGFNLVKDSEENHAIPYYSLLDDKDGNTSEKISDALPNMDKLLELCPTKTKTGITYCL